MSLFDNNNTEEFFLLNRNLNMTIEALGTLLASKQIQYHCTLVRGEVWYQFEMFSAEVGSNTSENLKLIVLGLGTYFFLLM